MQYALLIYETEADRDQRRDGGPGQAKVDAAYVAFTRALIEAGALRGGEALDLPEVATTLVAQGGDGPLIQDGPFADVKEQLGGFFIIEAGDLDEAIAWARRCPASARGKVEIRPCVVPPSADA